MKMGLFNRFGRNKRDGNELYVSVEIYEPVVKRITTSLLASTVEEGGKFLGTISEDGKRINIEIYSYIDAGPRVSNSQTHIIPDGEHQEYLFRIIEGYDSRIEHVGSWHSHHCNGYPELSSGDIQGYKQNVNDRNYNLNWFFVMLITKARQNGIEAKYYLFHRGDEKTYVIGGNDVVISNQEYRYENILREVERSTYSHRHQGQQSSYNSPTPIREGTRSCDEVMMGIRADDKAWIEKNFRSPRVFRNRKDESIHWRFDMPVNIKKLEISYAYPTAYEKSQQATLSIYCQDQEILRSNIDLDEYRFEHISSQIENAKAIVGAPQEI
jgi:hypothetical protein